MRISKFFRRDSLNLIPFGLGLPLLAACDRWADPDRGETPMPEPPGQDLPLLEKVSFGGTGLKVSRLAFGTGTHGVGGHSNQSALGVGQLGDLLVQAHDYGVNFWDAADDYGTHPHLARALQTVPRDQVVILTKTMSRRPERVTKDIERFLVELGTEVIDVVLIHFLTPSDWPQRYSGVMQALSRAKQAGKVRALGVSCHSLDALRSAAQSDWAEVVMARINYAGVNMDAAPQKVEPVLAELQAAGKAVIGMKVLGVGALAGEAQAAVEYVFNLGSVQAVTIGMTSQAQLEANIRAVGARGGG